MNDNIVCSVAEMSAEKWYKEIMSNTYKVAYTILCITNGTEDSSLSSLRWYDPESNSTAIYDVLCNQMLPNDLVILIMQYTSYYEASGRGKITWTDIPMYITHLTVLCTSIKFSTVNLVKLSCNSCRLGKLPALPSCKKLECRNNNLTALPRLDICEYLDCEHNKLTLLPLLPMCMFLNCRKNDISGLPEMLKLIRLECDHNEIVEIPYFPVCRYIKCTNNNFVEKPYKSESCIIEWYRKPW